MDPETGILTILPIEREHRGHHPVLVGAAIVLVWSLCIAGFVAAYLWSVRLPQSTPTSTPLPTVAPTRTPVPTSTPRTPTPVPLELFRGTAYVWPAKAAGFDNNFSVPGKPTGARAWLCWTGTAERPKSRYEVVVSLQPRCILGINSVYYPSYDGIGVSTDAMEKMGLDVLQYTNPRIAVFAWPGGLPPSWEIVDQ